MKCYQRVIRERENEPCPDVDLSKQNASVKAITNAEAKQVILKYEWLGTMAEGTKLSVGLYFGDYLAGVEVFTDTKPAGKYTLNKEPAICLARGACVSWAPNWASSFLVRKSLSFIDPAAYHYVLAYSDTEAGEVGSIYQAANFVCIGQNYQSYWLSPEGKRYDNATHRHRARKRENGKVTVAAVDAQAMKQRMLDDGWQFVNKGGKRYRYAEAIGNGRIYRQRRTYLESMSIPYPKREKGQ